MTSAVCAPSARPVSKLPTRVAQSSSLDSTALVSATRELCQADRQPSRRGKTNQTQGHPTLYLCCYLGILVYFMLGTAQNRQRAAPRFLLFLYSVNRPLSVPPPSMHTSFGQQHFRPTPTLLTVVIKERAPAAATAALPSHFCISLVTHLRHWRWLVITLIFFYGLVLSVAPARTDGAGVGPRVPGQPNVALIRERSQRSTEEYERLLKTNMGYVCLVDDPPRTWRPKLFVGIFENGTMEVTKDAKHELKVQLLRRVAQEEENEAAASTDSPFPVILSDKTGRWFLCLNGSLIISIEVLPGEDLPDSCGWMGLADATNIRVQPLVDPQRAITLGEHTASFRGVVVLRLEIIPELSDRRVETCAEVRALVQPAAKKDLSLAYQTLRKLQAARQSLKLALLRRKVPVLSAHATAQIINRVVQVRHRMKMEEWNYEGISVSNQKEFIGIAGCRRTVPETMEEEIDLYVAFRAHQLRLASEERELVQDLFNRTRGLTAWTEGGLLAYRRKPSLSGLLRGLNLLPRDTKDLETSLYIVARYLPSEYTSETIRHSPEVLQRANRLKLEEVMVRQRPRNLLVLSQSACVESWLKLPLERVNNADSASAICKGGT